MRGDDAMTDNEDYRTCEMCDYCVYIGEGDFACDERNYEIVIEDWIPLRKPCKKWTEK